MVLASLHSIQGPDQTVSPEDIFAPWGGAHAFVQQYASDPALQSNPQYQQLHQSLVTHASVCSFCGVGCPYAVVRDRHDKKKLVPLSPLGLCVKGQTSLITGGDEERQDHLHRRGKTGDRIRSPMIRKHDGTWINVSWEQALDRAA